MEQILFEPMMAGVAISAADALARSATTIGVKSIITQPNDDTETMALGVHMIRGYAWSGAGAIEAAWSEIGTVACRLIDRQFTGKAVLHIC